MNPKEYFANLGLWSATAKPYYAYLIGFVACITITLTAYDIAMSHNPSTFAILSLAGMAVLQFAVQLVCFLHLDFKKESRERLIILCCASVIVLILISGSLWIMFTLSGRMTPSTAQMEQYMNDQSGF